MSSRRRMVAWSFLWIAIVLLAIEFAQGLSYTFVWTYVAGHFNVRRSLTQDVAVCVTVGALISALVLQMPAPVGGVHEWRRRPWVPIGIFVGIVGVGLLRDRIIWETLDGGRIAWNSLIVAPLCMLLFVAANTMSGKLQRRGPIVKLAAVIAGVSATHGLLGEAGSIWICAIVCLIAVGMLLVIERWPNGDSPKEAVKTLILGFVIVALVQIAFGGFPLGWDVAILCVSSVSCWVVASAVAGVANLMSRHAVNAVVPMVESVTLRPWYEHFNACKLLPFGWVVVLFHTFCWTEPEMIVKAPRASVMEIPVGYRSGRDEWIAAPVPVLPTFPDSISEPSGDYSADVIEFERMLRRPISVMDVVNDFRSMGSKNVRQPPALDGGPVQYEPPAPVLVSGIPATHPGTVRLRQTTNMCNKNAETEVSARQFTKVTSWVFMFFSTFLWWCGQSAESTKPMEAQAAVSGKVHDRLALEGSVTLGHDNPAAGLLPILAPAKAGERAGLRDDFAGSREGADASK